MLEEPALVTLECVVLEIIAVKAQFIFVQAALITMQVIAVEGLELGQLLKDSRTVVAQIADRVRAQIHAL